MRPLLVLLVVLVAVGALLFGVYSLLGTPTPAQPEIAPVRVDPTADAGPEISELTGGPGATRQAQTAVESEAPERAPRSEAGVGATYANELKGTVVSPSGDPLGDVKVTLSSHQTGELRFVDEPVDPSKDVVTHTDSKGRYAFRNIAPRSNYRIVADHADYARTETLTSQIGESGVFEEPPLTMQTGAVLKGYVTDTAGNNVPDASLFLDGMFVLADGETADRAVTRTDVAGFYEFKNVPKGNNMRTLTVTASGYASQERQGLMFMPDKDEMTLDFTLQTALMLTGRVVGPDNQGIAQAKVVAIGTQASQKGARSRTLSDENGNFMFEDLSPGKYMVQASKKGWRYKAMPRAEAGEANVIIEMVREAVVSGRVVDAVTNQPVTSFTARMRFHYNDDVPTAPSDIKDVFASPEGTFSLEGIKEGTYVVEAQVEGYAPSFSLPFAVQRSQDMTGIEVRMTKGGALTGLVVDASGKPVANARVRTEDNEYVDDVFQMALGDNYPTNATTVETRTDARGRFVLAGLHEANYQVMVNASGYTEFALKDVLVADGTEKDVGTLQISQGGALRGALYDAAGKAVVAGHVSLEPTAYSGEGPFRKYETKSGQDGKFAFANVTPGVYRLMATRAGTLNGNPFEILAEAKNSERAVTIAEGETVTQDLTLVE